MPRHAVPKQGDRSGLIDPFGRLKTVSQCFKILRAGYFTEHRFIWVFKIFRRRTFTRNFEFFTSAVKERCSRHIPLRCGRLDRGIGNAKERR